VTTLAPFFKASAMCASTFSTAFMAQTQVWPVFLYFEAGAPPDFAGQALDRHLDIGIVEYDERRVAAQFRAWARVYTTRLSIRSGLVRRPN
jgi:hypothetical protein